MKRLHAGAWYAIAAALLFGASTPAAKPLLGSATPQLVAGLLYLGSGAGLFLLRLLRGRHSTETPLRKRDMLWMLGSIFFGGIAGPLLLMTGLARTPATTTSLMLNLETVFTALIAWIVFREHASLRTITGMAAILAGGVVLAWSGSPSMATLVGPLCIAGACVSWAIDNNLTRNISGSDPLEIASVKSLVAGGVNTSLAIFVQHAAPPSLAVIAISGVVGFFGYGLSLVFFVLALRHIGTARTGAYFSTAPFAGAALALLFGHGAMNWQLGATALLMGFGVWLHLSEVHEHEHEHETMQHDHLHVHDEHHQHEHADGVPMTEPHSHPHVHDALRHSHPHFPDLHHWHAH